ncbi:hypothetical protein PRIPAC_97283, partial [Pristionchus pacificus]|uniref:VWA domain-containing protein n=1 Tax=Pristionchus pacificus TaxID=54126 RepID=A0A2A6D181_PRIPA
TTESTNAVSTNANTAVNAILADGQSYLGYGMEAVKATTLLQPEHDNNTEDDRSIALFISLIHSFASRMKLLLFFSLVVAAYAHVDCGGDCLKACRSCGPLINDGEPGVNNTDPFYYGSKKPGDCKEAICKDEKAKLVVDGKITRVVCFQGAWHSGYPEYLFETASAMCLTPGNHTCDVDATYEYDEDDFKCVCKAPFVDVTKDFATEDETQFCSNCGNKKLNIILLVDNSGSMAPALNTVKTFIDLLVTFLKFKPDGNRIALMTSAFSYEIKINWGTPASTTESDIRSTLETIQADGQSYLGYGMEAVKAALVQPEHINEAEDHKLIVFTDGSVKHSPPAIKDITEAANNLEALKVETFVVATNNEYAENQYAIANGVEDNVFTLTDDYLELFALANRLQKRICQ